MIFCIPLKPKAKCSDWLRVCNNLSRTLESIKNQAGWNDNKVIIACHERPILKIEGVNIEYVLADWDVKDVIGKKYKDKSLKLKKLGVALQRHVNEYVMLLDADDLVSRNLSNFVHETAHDHGYCVERGYTFDVKNKKACGNSGCVE